RVAPVAFDEFEEAPLAGLHRGDLRAQIAHGPTRQADVLPDDVDHGRIDRPPVLIFADRDLQSLRKNIGAHAAGNAADVEASRQENATSLPLWKIGSVSVTWLRWLPVR